MGGWTVGSLYHLNSLRCPEGAERPIPPDGDESRGRAKTKKKAAAPGGDDGQYAPSGRGAVLGFQR